MTVRPAAVHDAAAVVCLHVRSRTEYYRGYLPAEELAAQNVRRVEDYARAIRSPDRAAWCAEIDGRIVGFLLLGDCYYPDPDESVTHELLQIHVEPDHFGRGIGSQLHAAAVAAWQELGVRAARLWVWEFNDRARAFYHRHGWLRDGHCRPDDPRIGQYRMLGYRLTVPRPDGAGPHT